MREVKALMSMPNLDTVRRVLEEVVETAKIITRKTAADCNGKLIIKHYGAPAGSLRGLSPLLNPGHGLDWPGAVRPAY